jgi:hypothetical protein
MLRWSVTRVIKKIVEAARHCGRHGSQTPCRAELRACRLRIKRSRTCWKVSSGDLGRSSPTKRAGTVKAVMAESFSIAPQRRGSIRSTGDRRHRSPKRGLCAYEANSNGKTFDHPQIKEGCRVRMQEGKCGMMQITKYAA